MFLTRKLNKLVLSISVLAMLLSFTDYANTLDSFEKTTTELVSFSESFSGNDIHYTNAILISINQSFENCFFTFNFKQFLLLKTEFIKVSFKSTNSKIIQFKTESISLLIKIFSSLKTEEQLV